MISMRIYVSWKEPRDHMKQLKEGPIVKSSQGPQSEEIWKEIRNVEECLKFKMLDH